jgi:hypothetical protein
MAIIPFIKTIFLNLTINDDVTVSDVLNASFDPVFRDWFRLGGPAGYPRWPNAHAGRMPGAVPVLSTAASQLRIQVHRCCQTRRRLPQARTGLRPARR